MVHSGLLINVVTIMMVFSYTSVRSLETGYIYTGKPVANDELYKDLKCSYLIFGYTQMRLVRVLLEDHSTEWKDMVGPVSNMNNVIRPQIISLFGLEGIRIGAMWLLHLFTSLISDFYQEIRNAADDRPDVNETLVYVIGKIHDDLAGCREGNSFDTYDIVRSRRAFGLYTYRKHLLPTYLDQARAQLAKNDIVSDYSLKLMLDFGMRVRSLFTNDLGTDDRLKQDLQNVYNLQIKWNDTSATLLSYWRNARAPDWKTGNLLPTKSYHDGCNDFLKIIIYRLTWKHMEYLRGYVFLSGAYVFYAQQWYTIVVRFGTMLNLSGDVHVKNLLHLLENLVGGIENIDSVVSYIAGKLDKLCQPFGCEASAPFVVDNREFQIKHTGLTENEQKSLRKPFSPVPIEFNSLANAKTFLAHLEMAFHHVNFTAIRSLTSYVDELNPVNCAQRSDDRAEELEHHLINISDYE